MMVHPSVYLEDQWYQHVQIGEDCEYRLTSWDMGSSRSGGHPEEHSESGQILIQLKIGMEVGRFYMSSISQENNNLESGCRYPYEKIADYEHLKKAVIGAYHRILLANDSYVKGYISYIEWHKRLEEEIVLIQTYNGVRTHIEYTAHKEAW